MGAKKKEKAAPVPVASKSAFCFPDPDRTVQLSVPAVAPPVDFEEDYIPRIFTFVNTKPKRILEIFILIKVLRGV